MNVRIVQSGIRWTPTATDLYDLWDGDVRLLTGATEAEIDCFMEHGHADCHRCV